MWTLFKLSLVLVKEKLFIPYIEKGKNNIIGSILLSAYPFLYMYVLLLAIFFKKWSSCYKEMFSGGKDIMILTFKNDLQAVKMNSQQVNNFAARHFSQ